VSIIGIFYLIVRLSFSLSRKRKLSKKRGELPAAVAPIPAKGSVVVKPKPEKAAKVSEKRSDRRKNSGKSFCDLHFRDQCNKTVNGATIYPFML
jgi:hypothetical protein